MRSEARGNGKEISRQKPVSPPKKRGRPKKVLPPVIEQMKADSEFAPQVKYLRDLAASDRTEIIEGRDPAFEYRWCEESKIKTREAQGYVKCDDPGLKTHWDSNYVPPEGIETRRVNRGGLVLMKIPRKLKEWRDKRKAEAVEAQMQAFDSQMQTAVNGPGSHGLPDSDDIVQEVLAGR